MFKKYLTFAVLVAAMMFALDFAAISYAADDDDEEEAPAAMTHWVDALIGMNDGRFKEAQEFLSKIKDKDVYETKLLADLGLIEKLQKAGKEGKYDDVKKGIGTLMRPGRYKGVCAILNDKLAKAKETGKWPEENKLPGKRPTIVLSAVDLFFIINCAEFEPAKRLINAGNPNDTMNTKVLDKVKRFINIEKLGREGKYDEAQKELDELKKAAGPQYASAIRIVNYKLTTAIKEKKWPETVPENMLPKYDEEGDDAPEDTPRRGRGNRGGGGDDSQIPPMMNQRILGQIAEAEEMAKQGKYDEALKQLNEIEKMMNGHYAPKCKVVKDKIEKAKADGKWPN